MGKPVTVLHIGDYDASGETLWNVLKEDVSAFMEEMGGCLTVKRIAVTPEQQQLYDLPTAPPKKDDKRGVYFTDAITMQAEALPPDLLLTILRDAIEAEMDLDALETTRQLEVEARKRAQARLSEPLDD